MKTEEDEAFDDLARRQGAWGGGFQAKRQAAMDKINSHFDAEYKKMHEDRAMYGTSWSKDGERIDPASVYLEKPAQEPVGTLNISCYKGHLVNHDFDYFGELPDGTYSVYTTPPLSMQPVQPVQEPVKLWLWKNFVDGKPEYWAFDNPFPIFMDSHDPQTLGEPCGYAWLKPSRTGRTDVTDEEVLRDVQAALAQPEPDMLTIAYQSGYHDGKKAALAKREWNFCERCGKRTKDMFTIHTCTPPQEKNT